MVFKAALGGCSLSLVLFKTACADWNCEMVWNGEHWHEYRQKHLQPAWVGLHFQIRGGGKGLCIREENGSAFKSSSSLHSAQWRGYAKPIKSKIIKSSGEYLAQEKVTTPALLFLDVLTTSLSPFSPKGSFYSALGCF